MFFDDAGDGTEGAHAMRSTETDLSRSRRLHRHAARMLLIARIAIVIGVVSAFVALALLTLIGFFTNLFFFQRCSTALVSPAAQHARAAGRCSCRSSAR